MGALPQHVCRRQRRPRLAAAADHAHDATRAGGASRGAPRRATRCATSRRRSPRAPPQALCSRAGRDAHLRARRGGRRLGAGCGGGERASNNGRQPRAQVCTQRALMQLPACAPRRARRRGRAPAQGRVGRTASGPGEPFGRQAGPRRAAARALFWRPAGHGRAVVMLSGGARAGAGSAPPGEDPSRAQDAPPATEPQVSGAPGRHRPSPAAGGRRHQGLPGAGCGGRPARAAAAAAAPARRPARRRCARPGRARRPARAPAAPAARPGRSRRRATRARRRARALLPRGVRAGGRPAQPLPSAQVSVHGARAGWGAEDAAGVTRMVRCTGPRGHVATRRAGRPGRGRRGPGGGGGRGARAGAGVPEGRLCPHARAGPVQPGLHPCAPGSGPVHRRPARERREVQL